MTIVLIVALAIIVMLPIEWWYLREIVGSIVLLFVPGWWITKAAFKTEEIDGLERVALSFALSIAVVPLLVFYANLMGAKISVQLVLVVVLVVVLASMGILAWRKR